jgi:hypothetical protein
MDIIFQGQHEIEEAIVSLGEVLQLFETRYHIKAFQEIRLSLNLIDAQGNEVELVDSESNQAYRVFEVYRNGYELKGRRPQQPKLKLVVDNR